MKQGIRYFIYARKSSESEDRQVQSIEDQLTRLALLQKDMGLNVVGEPFTESLSGKNPFGRPVFEDMLRRIEAGEADGILCWKVNRLSRNPVDSGRIQWMLQQGIIKSIQTIERKYLPEDNALILSVESGTANQFILDLSRDTKRGLVRKLEKGWATSLAPQGYLNDTSKPQGERDIIKDPERFDLVKKMWKMMLTGAYSPPDIITIANEEWGFRTRRTKRKGGNPLCSSTVYRMFNNPFYAGIIVRRDGSQYVGKHEAMVTIDEFQRVQQLLKNRGNNFIRPKTYDFAFTGFIRCSECGCLLTAEKHTKYIKATNSIKSYTYYHCTNKKPNYNCSQKKKFLREEMLEEQADQILSKYTILPEFRDWAIDIVKNSNDQEIIERSKSLESNQKAILEAQKRLDNLTQMRLRELIDDEEYKEQKPKIRLEIDCLRSKQKEIEERADNWIELTEKAFDFACFARTHFNEGDWRKKKEIMMALGQNTKCYEGKLDVEPCSWLQLIAKEYPAIEEKFKRFELTDFASEKEKTEALTSVLSYWGG